MLTKTQEQVLIFLLENPDNQFTIRGIAKKLKKSYTLIYNNISELEKRGIIRKQSIPPGQIVSLNKFMPVDIFIDIELKRKKEFLKKNPWIRVMLEDILKTVESPFFILLIFGSYAKGTQTPKSDVDVLAIVQDKEDIKAAENIIHNAYTKTKKSVNIIDADNFKKMIKNTGEMNIGNETRKYHIILHGAEIYYQLIKEVI